MKNINCINEKSIEKCLQYSNEPEKLKEIISHLSVRVEFGRIEKYFSDDEKPRLTGVFFLENKVNNIKIPFGFSLYDTVLELFPHYLDINRKVVIGTNPLDNFDFRKKIHNFIGEDWRLVKISEVKEKLQNFYDSLLYNILTSCKNDYFCSKKFSDWCSDFGYDNDSIKAKETWEKCLELSSDLESIFSEKDIEYLPS